MSGAPWWTWKMYVNGAFLWKVGHRSWSRSTCSVLEFVLIRSGCIPSDPIYQILVLLKINIGKILESGWTNLTTLKAGVRKPHPWKVNIILLRPRKLSVILRSISPARHCVLCFHESRIFHLILHSDVCVPGSIPVVFPVDYDISNSLKRTGFSL